MSATVPELYASKKTRARGMMRAVNRGGPENQPRFEANWLVAVAATLGMTVSYIDRQTLAVVAPWLELRFGVGPAQFGWLIGAFSFAYLVGTPVAGVLVDRLGARRGFAIALLVWSVIAATNALASTFVVFFVLRVLLGLAESPSFPSGAQAIRRALPNRGRAAAYGLLFTGSSIGATIAAPLALYLARTYEVRVTFLVTAAIGLSWLPLWLFATRGGALRARQSSTIVVAKDDAPYRGPTTIEVTRPSWLSVATSAAVLRALVAVIGSAPSILFVINFSSLYFANIWRIDRAFLPAYYVALPPLVFDIGAVGFGFLATLRDRVDPHASHKALMLLAGVLATGLGFVPFVHTPDAALACFTVAALGGGGMYVLCTADMMKRVPADRSSAAGGLTAAAQSLSHIIGAPLIGAHLATVQIPSRSILLVLGGIVLPAAVAWCLWPGLSPAQDKE
jgi:ACS family hexuronate transporter-like MFS transporter